VYVCMYVCMYVCASYCLLAITVCVDCISVVGIELLFLLNISLMNVVITLCPSSLCYGCL